MTMQAAAGRKRRLFPRMRVATLLVLVAAVGGPAGWYIHGARVQRQAVRALRDAGAIIVYDWECDPDAIPFRRTGKELAGWRRFAAERFGPDSVASVAAVLLHDVEGENGPGATDEHIALVGRLKSLRELGLGTFAITEAGAAPIAGLGRLECLRVRDPLGRSDPGPILSRLGEDSRLKWVSLVDAAIDGDDIAAISRLSRLEALQITRAGMDIGDADLARLAALGRLKTLRISSSRITSGGLKAIGGMKRLESISIGKSSIDDTAPLLQLPALRELDLGHCQIGDNSLSALAEMPRLERLFLGSRAITDAGLARLRGAPALEVLELQSDSITAAGLEPLAAIKALRRIRLFIGGPGISPEAAKGFADSHPGTLLDIETREVADIYH